MSNEIELLGIIPEKTVLSLLDGFFEKQNQTESKQEYEFLKLKVSNKKCFDLIVESKTIQDNYLVIIVEPDKVIEITRSQKLPVHFHENLLSKAAQQWEILLPYLDTKKAFLSGGSLVAAWKNLEDFGRSREKISDIDVWVGLKETLFEILMDFEKKFNRIYILNIGSVTTILVEGFACPVQLILYDAINKKPQDIVGAFDMDYVKAFYYGKDSLWCFPEALESWKQNKILKCSSIVRKDRLQKAVDKGFDVSQVHSQISSVDVKNSLDYFYPGDWDSVEYNVYALKKFYPKWDVFTSVAEFKRQRFNSLSCWNLNESYGTTCVSFDQVKDLSTIELVTPDDKNSNDKDFILFLKHPITFSYKHANITVNYKNDDYCRVDVEFWKDSPILAFIKSLETHFKVLTRSSYHYRRTTGDDVHEIRRIRITKGTELRNNNNELVTIKDLKNMEGLQSMVYNQFCADVDFQLGFVMMSANSESIAELGLTVRKLRVYWKG